MKKVIFYFPNRTSTTQMNKMLSKIRKQEMFRKASNVDWIDFVKVK
jgi:hypothetical protein